MAGIASRAGRHYCCFSLESPTDGTPSGSPNASLAAHYVAFSCHITYTGWAMISDPWPYHDQPKLPNRNLTVKPPHFPKHCGDIIVDTTIRSASGPLPHHKLWEKVNNTATHPRFCRHPASKRFHPVSEPSRQHGARGTAHCCCG